MQKNKTESTIIFWLHRIEDIVVTFLLSSILVFAVTQIILRNFFQSGIIWADNLLRILVLWLALAGAILASRQGKQINIDIFSQFIPDAYRHYIEKINFLFAAVICMVISYYSFQFVRFEYVAGGYAFAEIPAWLAEAIIPFGFAIMGLRYLAQTLISNKKSSNPGL